MHFCRLLIIFLIACLTFNTVEGMSDNTTFESNLVTFWTNNDLDLGTGIRYLYRINKRRKIQTSEGEYDYS